MLMQYLTMFIRRLRRNLIRSQRLMMIAKRRRINFKGSNLRRLRRMHRQRRKRRGRMMLLRLGKMRWIRGRNSHRRKMMIRRYRCSTWSSPSGSMSKSLKRPKMEKHRPQ